jgi:hypothetical protein
VMRSLSVMGLSWVLFSNEKSPRGRPGRAFLASAGAQ